VTYYLLITNKMHARSQKRRWPWGQKQSKGTYNLEDFDFSKKKIAGTLGDKKMALVSCAIAPSRSWLGPECIILYLQGGVFVYDVFFSQLRDRTLKVLHRPGLQHPIGRGWIGVSDFYETNSLGEPSRAGGRTDSIICIVCTPC
jgi:hypothetical protein